jgi:sec-independent protein translocase protein TatA
MNLGWMEITLLVVVVLLLFGARRLPELGKGLGSGIRNFKSSLRDGERGELPEGRSADTIGDGSEQPTYRKNA